MIRCPRLYTLERATVNSTERKYNSIVKITCNPGYTFKTGRSFTTRCNESANWSGMPQSCERRYTLCRCKARNNYVCWKYTLYVGNKLYMLGTKALLWERTIHVGNVFFIHPLYVGYKLFLLGIHSLHSEQTIYVGAFPKAWSDSMF